MHANFAAALAATLKHEGGWADHPKDPGGATMKGVTLATFRRLVKPDATKDDLRKITNAQLEAVYRKGFWSQVMADQLPAGVDFAVFDYAVNSGPGRAVKALQTIVGAKVDGIVGPETLKAVNAYGDVARLINALCDQRQAFVERLKTWPTFGKGWTSRIKGVRKLALEMAATGKEPVPAPTMPPKAEKPHTDDAAAQDGQWEIDWFRVGVAVVLGGVFLFAILT